MTTRDSRGLGRPQTNCPPETVIVDASVGEIQQAIERLNALFAETVMDDSCLELCGERTYRAVRSRFGNNIDQLRLDILGARRTRLVADSLPPEGQSPTPHDSQVASILQSGLKLILAGIKDELALGPPTVHVAGGRTTRERRVAASITN